MYTHSLLMWIYNLKHVQTDRHVGVQAHGFSQEASFQAAPTIGPESHIRFLAIADMGQAEIDGSNEESEMIPALNTTRLMIAEADDKQLLIHNGDISYARCDPCWCCVWCHDCLL
jgi:hypothetical protein